MHMFRRTGVFTIALSCLALAQSQPSPGARPNAGDIDWRFAHPNADVRMSINLASVLRSPLVTEIVRQAEARADQKQAAQIQFALGILSSIDRVSISAIQTYGGGSDALVLVKGRFDPQSIQKLFPSRGKSQVRQLDENTLLIGEGASFTDAVHRMNIMGDPKGLKRDELEKNDIWLGGGSKLLSKQAAQAPPAFRSLRGFSLGINLGEAPELNLILNAADPAAAGQVLAGFQELVAQFAQAPQAAALLEKALSMQQDGARVRLHYAVSPEVLRMAEAQAASRTAASFDIAPLLGILGMPQARSPAAPLVPVPDTGGKIMIYGLDGGPQEVKQ